MRLDKLLSHAGYGTRKEVKKLITGGLISVNGETVTQVGFKVNPELDKVSYMGDSVNYQEYYYIMLNKPDGIISATEDGLHQTVIEWVDLDYHHVELFPVGRLDIDTTGLLLLTNNGQLAHQLMSPKKGVEKTYQAKVKGIVNQKDIDKFAKGLNLGDFVTAPAELRIISIDHEHNESSVEVIITEGKFHQVKRMFEAVDKLVIQLHRISVGPLLLDHNLAVGEYRELTGAEMALLEPYGLVL